MQKRFENENKAIDQLRKLLPEHPFNQISKILNIIDEPYFKSILNHCFYFESNSEIAKIPISKGSKLLIIHDPINILKEDEIYIKIINDEGNIQVIESNVLIYSDSCIYPSD